MRMRLPDDPACQAQCGGQNYAMNSTHLHGPRPTWLVWLILVVGLVLPPTPRLQAQTTTNAFEKDILAFEAADRTNPPAPGAILFAGDSQFTRWKTIHEDLPEYRIINRGFGGSKMSDLLFYTDRIVMPYRPRMIVVNEGGNDLHAGRTPEQVFTDLKAFVTKVRAAWPEVPIIINGLTPSTARWSESGARLRYNELLKAYVAAGTKLTYLDLFDKYLGPDGKPREELFVADKLHHSPAGYTVRMGVLRPALGTPDYPDHRVSK